MKYGNKKTEVDGLTFDSKREAERYIVLRKSELIGIISNLEIQKTFELIPKQKLSTGKTQRSVKYIADFYYNMGSVKVCEDSKGVKTPDYIIKRKLMKFIHNIEIKET